MKSYLIKRVSIVAILCMGIFVALMPSTSYANYYEIESLYQSIIGNNSLKYPTWEDVDGDGYPEEIWVPVNQSFFHESTSSPVYMHDSIWGGQATLSSTFDGNQFSASLFTGFDFMGRPPGGTPPDDFDGCWAELNLIFTPTVVSEWQFETYSGYPITLKDVTTGNLLINSTGHLWPGATLTLYPSHNYALHMISNGYDEDARNFASVSAIISAIPEPATMLLLGLGLFGLAGFKRKMQN